MVIALAFSTLALFSLLVYFIYLIRRHLPSFIRESTLLNHVVQIAKHLEWACDFWLCYSLFPNYNYVPNYMPAEAGAGQGAAGYECWKLAALADAGTECPVCLYKVEEGEEIGELICGHIFHRFCLETWAYYRNLACPLCRGPLAPARSLDFESELVQRDVSVSEFYSFWCSDHRDRWWLRQ